MKLKPCPFCGRQPETYWDNINHTEGFNILCKCNVIHIDAIYKEDAVAKWNTRHDEWIPIEERLPESEQYVLVFISLGRMAVMYYVPAWGWCPGGMSIGHPTYWRPLPEPPKE